MLQRKINLLVLVFAIQTLTFVRVPGNKTENLPEVYGNKFYYFGYGSNMLTKRIHIQNPTAVKIGPGLLQNYRLDFNLASPRWKGSVATVVEDVNRTVQGTLWQLDLTNLSDLDDQEGVHQAIYKPSSVSVEQLHTNRTLTARIYLLVKQPANDLKELERESIPFDRQPSKTYLQCLIKGAIETHVEAPYIEWLKSLKHNGNVVESFESLLELKDVEVNA